MKIIEYIPFVLEALVAAGGSMKQTDLTVAVWGTSGRGNTTLTQSLFPYMVGVGLLNMTTKGRSKTFTVSDKGQKWLDAYVDKQHAKREGLTID